MSTFFESATTYIDDAPASDSRRELWDAFRRVGLPTVSDEVWRYAPLSELALDDFSVPDQPGVVTDSTTAEVLRASSPYLITTVDGFLAGAPTLPTGVSVEVVSSAGTLGDQSFVERYGDDAFALLNGASSPGSLDVRVDPKVTVDEPIIVLHQTTRSSSFPSVRVHVGAGARVSFLECLVGAANALVVTLAEYQIGDDAHLAWVTYQRLDDSAWHIARTTSMLQRDARVHQSVIGLGAHYNRSRNDAEFLGTGSENELRTTFLGSGTQVHDFRSHQLHRVGRTRSTLLSKGAVADHSRSVYTGLIEIDKGAKRTDARQTNHNLLLSPNAHADSVPNLDIRENDVMCAHASSVGPLDELQRWYLESRGVPREEAERLMIQGFFNEMTDSLPASVARLVDNEVAGVLATTHVVAP